MNVYDFDKTIYNGDSTIDFYLFSLRKKPSLIRYLPIQIFGFVLYYCHKIDKTRLKEKFFCFIKSIDCEKYVIEFWTQKQKKMAGWYTEQQKDDDVVISASPEFLLRPCCEQIGIKHLIASEVDSKTGNFLNENCYGAKKVDRFKEAFGECRIDSFYSDSLSDSPMAQLADRAFLVTKKGILKWGSNDE